MKNEEEFDHMENNDELRRFPRSISDSDGEEVKR